MRRLLVTITLALAALAQTTAAPDFSGTWVLNTAKSVLPKGSTIKSQTIVIDNKKSAIVYQNSVSLTCTGIPGKINCAFSPVSVSPGANGGSSTLTISLDQSAVQTGTYTVAVVGTSGSLTHSTPLQLTLANKH